MKKDKTKLLKIAVLEKNADYLSEIKNHLAHPAIMQISQYVSIDDLLNVKLSYINILILDIDNELSTKNYPDFEQQILKLKEIASHIKIIIISPNTAIPPIVALFKVGIVDYIVKDKTALEKLTTSINDIINFWQLNKKFAFAKISRNNIKRRLLIHGVIFSIIILIIVIKNIL